MAASPAPQGILSVSQLTRLIKETLTGAFPAVWVKGELTGFKRGDRGHLYFCLKDAGGAQLDCVMFRTPAARLRFEPRDGAELEAFGSITVYEPRGRYQLVAEELRLAGIGALLAKLEELKRRLQAEGLFDPERKKLLPRYPQRIGLVTSPVGAAVRDLVKVLRARWPSIELVLAPVRVQGEGAAGEIVAAIRRFNRYAKVDLLIVGRGGGSLEDLWAFNEEPVARAIAGSRIPVISAVGHEVDLTLADLAADVRAATPSNAAEIAVRDRRDVLHRLESLDARLGRSILRCVAERQRRLQSLIAKYGFKRQRDVFAMFQQRVDELLERLKYHLKRGLARARERLEAARAAYGLREWPRVLEEKREETETVTARLGAAVMGGIAARRARLTGFEDRLRGLSPRRVMERGYCLVRRPDGSLVRLAAELSTGESITVEFKRGEADARVESIRRGEEHGTE